MAVKPLIDVLKDALKSISHDFLECEMSVLGKIDFGNYHLSKGDVGEAEFYFREALQQVPEDSYAAGIVHMSLGRCRLVENDKEKACEKFRLAEDLISRAVKLDPNDACKYFLLGICYYGLNDFKAAETALEKSLEINPKDQNVHNLLGDCYYIEERFEEAKSEYQKALSCIAGAESLLEKIEKCSIKLSENDNKTPN